MASVRQLYVNLILRAETYNNELRKAQREAKEFEKNIRPMTQAVAQIGTVARTAGAALTAGLTVPLVGIAAVSTKAARDFESSFAGVRKTVDATEPELQALAQGFRDMAKEIPVSVVELNRIGEAAGQLGIKKENILQFTRTMADLGATTNLTSEQAATSIAQLQNAMGESGKDVDRFGAALVALGNAGASTEKDILEMAQRIAGAGRTVNLSQSQVLGFAAALADVGINAEAGGSAISRVFLRMNDAVKGGGAALEKFATIAGMSGAQFKQAFEKDAASATAAFIKGLNGIRESGGNASAAIESVLGKNIIIKDVLLRAANAGEILADRISLSGRAWEENAALVEEARKRYATFDSQFQMFKSRLNDVAITIGTALLPVLLKLMDMAQPLIDVIAKAAEWFQKLPGPVQTAVVAVLALVAAVGPLLFIFGQLAISISGLIPAISGSVAALKTIGTALGSLQLLTAVRSLGDLRAAISLIGSTSLLAKAGLVGLAAGVGIAIGSFINARIEGTRFREALDDIARSIGSWLFSGQVTAAVKETEAGIRKMEEAALKLGISVERGTMTQEQYTSALAKAVREYHNLDKTVKDASGKVVDFSNVVNGTTEALSRKSKQEAEAAATAERHAAAVEEATEKAKRAAEEWTRLKESFVASLKPADDLEQTLVRLQKEFGNAAVLKVYGDQIIEATKKQKEHGIEISANMAKLNAMALAARAVVRELELVRASIPESLPRGSIELIRADIPETLGETGNVMAELGRKSQAAAEQIRRVEDRVQQMVRAGATNAQIMEHLGDEINEVARASQRTGEPLGRMTEQIARQSQEISKSSQLMQSFSVIVRSAVDRSIDAFSDMVVRGKFHFDTFKEIARDTASNMLSSFLKGFIEPFTSKLAGLAGRIGGGLADALFGGSSGGGGISSVLGGIFGGGSGGAGGILGKILGGGGGDMGGDAAMAAGGPMAAAAGSNPVGLALQTFETVANLVGKIGAGRRAADEVVKLQNAFTSQAHSILTDNTLNAVNKSKIFENLVASFESGLTRFAATDPNNQKVANQALAGELGFITQARKDLSFWLDKEREQASGTGAGGTVIHNTFHISVEAGAEMTEERLRDVLIPALDQWGKNNTRGYATSTTKMVVDNMPAVAPA